MKIKHGHGQILVEVFRNDSTIGRIDALESPHECSVPNCPGNRNRLRLELFDEMLAALERVSSCCHSEPQNTCVACGRLATNLVNKAKSLK